MNHELELIPMNGSRRVLDAQFVCGSDNLFEELVEILGRRLDDRLVRVVDASFELGRLDEGSSSAFLDAFEEELLEKSSKIGAEPRSVFLEHGVEGFLELLFIRHTQALYASQNSGVLVLDVPRSHVHGSSIFGLEDGSIGTSPFNNAPKEVSA
jgi:hypothetical protein